MINMNNIVNQQNINIGINRTNNIINNNNNNDNDDKFIGLTQKENIENEKREKEGMIKINPVNCGRELNWDGMEDCPDEILAKLKEIAVDDYYSGLKKISNKIKEK